MNQLQTPFVRNLSLNIVTLAANALLLLAMSLVFIMIIHLIGHKGAAKRD